MKKHYLKIFWSLLFILGMFFMVYGFSFKKEKDSSEGSEKCDGSKISSGINIKSFSRHFLDFSK